MGFFLIYSIILLCFCLFSLLLFFLVLLDSCIFFNKLFIVGSMFIFDDGIFVLGFFFLFNLDKKYYYYVGMWYVNIFKDNVVWVVNCGILMIMDFFFVMFVLMNMFDFVLFSVDG